MGTPEHDTTATGRSESDETGIATANHPEPAAMTVSRSDWDQLPGDPVWKDEMVQLGKVKLD